MTGTNREGHTADARNVWIARTEARRYRRVREKLAPGGNGYYWTIGAAARRGDLVLLYGISPAREFGLVGVVLREPQKSDADGNYWSEIWWMRVREPLTIDALEASGDPHLEAVAKLAKTRGPHAQIRDRDAAERVIERLLQGSARANAAVERWSRNRMPDPYGNDLSGQKYRRGTPSGTAHERKVQDQIRGHLIRRGIARSLRKRDGIKVPDSQYLGREVGFPDLVLVSLRERSCLLLIEVKRWAVPGDTTSGIPQLLRYEKALRRKARGWEIRKRLIALDVDPLVLKKAKRGGIETYKFKRRPLLGGSLKRL
jgi:hypothetical protein